MAAFLVATVTISDLEKFKAYAQTIAGVSEKYGGEAIVKGAVADVLEGDVPEGERVVVVKFPDEASARGYIADAKYQEGKQKRAGAAIVHMRLIVD